MKKTYQLPEKKTIIIVTGGPGTGKSYAARTLLKYLPQLQAISYDEIKEKEWDAFGFDDVSQKDRVNAWALEEFYLLIQKKMWEGDSILIEYPFYQRHKPKLLELIENYHYQAVTLFLYADMKVVYDRGCKRDSVGNRHPGHLLNHYHKETYKPEDLGEVHETFLTFEEFSSQISKKNYDINLGIRIPVDVSDFAKVDYSKTVDEMRKQLSQCSKSER